MSLDVYLTTPGETYKKLSGIYVREHGKTFELSREEWDRRNPGREPTTIDLSQSNQLYSANITHNLTRMATEAGIYRHLWRPEEIGITKAKELITPLERGLQLLLSDPARFKTFNPANGWGDFEGFCDFVGCYLIACRQFPEAEVSVSR